MSSSLCHVTFAPVATTSGVGRNWNSRTSISPADSASALVAAIAMRHAAPAIAFAMLVLGLAIMSPSRCVLDFHFTEIYDGRRRSDCDGARARNGGEQVLRAKGGRRIHGS